ncbi:hypothetical protein [Aliikangiella coralliicola]|uniref:Uncharacterized protein n=1 Tax=Aliikangiella coralliicola TaxID=2592383 RepID=A0A545UJP4_9GAMM|nr:hypothetical protein [Aliikangiella coralliicola]TQV89653.1 hypothetical protein FLL46_01860 [Aliikangiella coralliicola]
MSITHPETEFRIILKPSGISPSLEELRSLRDADVKAREVALFKLREEITNTGNWTIESLEYFDVSDFKEKSDGSTWQIDIETVEL